jgi:hypothetical protein
MKKYLCIILCCIIAVASAYLFIKVDENSKAVAGYLEGNTIFRIDKDDGVTTITILNEKFEIKR